MKKLKKIWLLTIAIAFLLNSIPYPAYAMRMLAGESLFKTEKEIEQIIDLAGRVGQSTNEVKEIVDSYIEMIKLGEAPPWIAENYRPGYLLIKDALKGGDSKKGKIKQAKEHLYKTTTDSLIRQRVEFLLAILEEHPQAEELTLLQFEGIAHCLVRDYSGDPNAYREYKSKLNSVYSEIYPDFRDKILAIADDKKRLETAMIYAGIANLIDPSHSEALKKTASDLGLEIDVSGEISVDQLIKLVEEIYQNIEKEKYLIGEEDFEQFFNYIKKYPKGLLVYFLDNHGEIILDQLVIGDLLEAGHSVAVVARGEVIRDDVTVDEAKEIIGRNEHLKRYLDSGKLQIITDGSYLLGADLTQSSKHPEFLNAWKDAVAYIAKGAGNWHTLLGQQVSLPGLYIRMMKGSANAYARISQIKGESFIQRSSYELAFVHQPNAREKSLTRLNIDKFIITTAHQIMEGELGNEKIELRLEAARTLKKLEKFEEIKLSARIEADLHTHTHHSDGNQTPAALVYEAYRRGLKAIAVTDHDSFEGVIEAIKAGRIFGVEIMPGIELSTDQKGVEILVYFPDIDKFINDYKSGKLNKRIDVVTQAKKRRMETMIERIPEVGDFRHKGIALTIEELKKLSRSRQPVNLGTLSMVLWNKYKSEFADLGCKNSGEVHNKYTIPYLLTSLEINLDMSPEAVAKSAQEMGGLPVLAHPKDIENKGRLSKNEIKELMFNLASKGFIIGVQVDDWRNANEDTESYIAMVNECNRLNTSNKLQMISGSDHHELIINGGYNYEIGRGRIDEKNPKGNLRADLGRYKQVTSLKRFKLSKLDSSTRFKTTIFELKRKAPYASKLKALENTVENALLNNNLPIHKTLILYSKPLLENAGVIDLKETLEILVKDVVLDRVVLYAEDSVYNDILEGLLEYIKSKIEIIRLTKEEVAPDISDEIDEIKEIKLLIDFVDKERDINPEDILCVVKGTTKELLEEQDIPVNIPPIVVFEKEGPYSIAEAINRLVTNKEMFIILTPIETTSDIQEELEKYQETLEVLTGV